MPPVETFTLDPQTLLATNPAQSLETIQKMGYAPPGRPHKLRQLGVGRAPRQSKPASGRAGGRQPEQSERKSPFRRFGRKISDGFFVTFHPEREILYDLLRETTVSLQALEKLRFSEDDYFRWRESLRDLVHPPRPQQMLFAKHISSREMVEDHVAVA